MCPRWPRAGLAGLAGEPAHRHRDDEIPERADAKERRDLVAPTVGSGKGTPSRDSTLGAGEHVGLAACFLSFVL